MTIWYFVFSTSILLIVFGLFMGPRLSQTAQLSIGSLLSIFGSFPIVIWGHTGIDYAGYLELYADIPSLGSWLSGQEAYSLSVEPGYQALVMISKTVDLSVHGPTIFLYFVSIFLVLRSSITLRVGPLLVLGLFFLLIYPEFFAQIRMAFVYTLGFTIIGFLQRLNAKGILFASVIGSTIQYVALAFLPCILLVWYFKASTLERRRWGVSNHRPRISFNMTLNRITIPTIIALLFSFILLALEVTILDFIWLVEIFHKSVGGDSSILGKFLDYSARNQEADFSFLGMAIRLVIVIAVLVLVDSASQRSAIGYSNLFLSISILALAFSFTFPILSYRLHHIYNIPALIGLYASLNRNAWGPFLLSLPVLSLALKRFTDMFGSISLIGS